MRTTATFSISDPIVFKEKLLLWGQQFREIVFLDSNEVDHNYSNYDFVLAVDALTSIKTDSFNAFDELKQYQQQTSDWLFGYLSYDLKNDVEDLTSSNFDGLAFPELFFFQPKKLFLGKGNQVEVCYLYMCDDEIEYDFQSIENNSTINATILPKVNIQTRIDKITYLEKVKKILQYIQLGEIYEVNFCQEFFAENTEINPYFLYRKLNQISKPPFAFYFKNFNHFAVSASPERYLLKNGTKVVTQPIKGTAKRGNDSFNDIEIKNQLEQDIKERSENIMIVDLVRNDLSKTAEKGSVKVEELCKVYTFPQVHQMISTIVSEVPSTLSPIEILKTTFPMGSMTGAPKIAAMKIIEEVELSKRGLYSGAVGYFTPNNDFDFNVVIRTILYNQEKRYLSFSVGSAITAPSIPELEYQECLLKANAMIEVLTSSNSNCQY